MIVNKVYTTEQNLDIKGIRLLTAGETETLIPENLFHYGNWWWLKDKGDDSRLAMCVWRCVDRFGNPVVYNHIAIRPALEIKFSKKSGWKIGDHFLVHNVTFVIVSQDLAFCVTELATGPFDVNGNNDYNKSSVKSFLENWLNQNETT